MRFGILGTALVALSACSGGGHHGVDPRSLHYEQRHALSLQQQEHTLPILVGAGATRLTTGDRTALTGFVRTYDAQGSGSLRIRVPSDTLNAAAASAVLGDMHDVISSAGGDPHAIAVEHYLVSAPHANAPILVVYDRLEAVTGECGMWPDGMNEPLSQRDYYNYGCATQANFGAILADPRDLVRPRGVGRPDAGRRAEVLARYRRGEATASEPNDPEGAAVADVN